MKGIFITIEGPDGAGKTSIIEDLKNYMMRSQRSYLFTREPGGITISESIRDIILNTKNISMDPRTEALLYAASRRQHLVEKVIPALNNGRIVICDRFIDSSLAYQGYARGLGVDEVMSINKFAIEDNMPDLTIYLDVEPEVGLARIAKNKNREINRLDLEKLEFHKKVRAGYKTLLTRYGDRIREVDASKDREEVFNEVLQILKEFLNSRGLSL
ncbi:dTMP kinase [Clostridium polynesiense]|uniref:dTMP kinase n=1 Tax=Clostridium polynesiense TaxID=1325933 RepID=UPI00058EA836|nr:dTMP kinase [Clostridium polynesiense]